MPAPRTLLAALAVLLVAGTCAGLGIWQLGRYRERTAFNERLKAALAAPAEPLPADTSAARVAAGRPGRFTVRGRFDESRQILLVGRSRDGLPGVHVVTPLVRDDGGPAVLVDRGFQPADDAATAVPAPEPVVARVVAGLVEPLEASAHRGHFVDALWRPVPGPEGSSLWSARWLVADSIATALPYAVAPVLLRELEGDGVPPLPARSQARFANTSVHLSYAGQWFVFGLIALVGPLFLARARRRRGEAS